MDTSSHNSRHTALRVALIDDSQVVRDSLGLLLEGEGYRVRSFSSAEEFLAHASEVCADQERPAAVDALLTDLRMPGLSGLELIHALDDRNCGIPQRGVISAFWTDSTRREAADLHVTLFDKGGPADEILNWLQHC